MQGFDKISSVLQIIADLNIDPAANAALAVNVGDLWDSYADKAAIYPRLQDLYVRRHVCDNLLGGVWTAIEWQQADVHEKGGDQFLHLGTLRENYDTLITQLEAHARANRTPATGRSFRAQRSRGHYDPSNPAYGGWPTKRVYLDDPF